jgi:hypothetical protein
MENKLFHTNTKTTDLLVDMFDTKFCKIEMIDFARYCSREKVDWTDILKVRDALNEWLKHK